MMKVIKKEQKLYEALQFTNESKDNIYAILAWYKCQRYPSFDDDNNPILLLQYGMSTDEVKISFGDWIILDTDNNTVIEVLDDEKFNKKYMPMIDTNTFPNVEIVNL